MAKKTVAEILLWLLSAAIVAIVSIRLRVDSWMLVRRMKREVWAGRKLSRKSAAPDVPFQ